MSRALIMSCSGTKLWTEAPASEMYGGPLWRTYRAALQRCEAFSRTPPDLFVLSAEYGLISGHVVIKRYEQRLTEERASALIEAGGIPISLRNYYQIGLAGGALYRMTMNDLLVRGGVAHKRLVSPKEGSRIGEINHFVLSFMTDSPSRPSVLQQAMLAGFKDTPV